MQIDIQGLTKTYTTWNRGSTFSEVLKSLVRREKTDIHALKGIDLSIDSGELVGFLGPNGAGKSTMLKILTGVLYPTAGSVSVMGVCPWKDRKKYVAGIGAVFGQKSQLVWDIPPADSFMMNQAIYRIPDARFRRTMDRLVDMLSVRDQMKQPTRNLSLGERMKCEFIMAMLHEPRIVFLDEPTIGLDVIAKDIIRAFIQEMNRDGVTFILTTHDLDDVERLAQRVIVINHGNIVFDDGISALRKHFGAKKIITASCAAPCFVSTEDGVSALPSGVSLLSRLSESDVVLECDTSVMDLPSLIRLVSETFGLRDLAVEDIPIETVIKELYAKE
ncbi:MAG TPA: ATP-binding cassette domain-containing protein [Treponemataceae bacterium]|nr:ATP-binding cassette domain-containing protein [Treponemataceae bacterium]